MARAEAEGRTTATLVETDQFRGVTELTILAPDHPRLLAIVTGACAASGGNIVATLPNATANSGNFTNAGLLEVSGSTFTSNTPSTYA
jgi:UTP:GlnB (protein PII) uridylyltransferase